MSSLELGNDELFNIYTGQLNFDSEFINPSVDFINTDSNLNEPTKLEASISNNDSFFSDNHESKDTINTNYVNILEDNLSTIDDLNLNSNSNQSYDLISLNNTSDQINTSINYSNSEEPNRLFDFSNQTTRPYDSEINHLNYRFYTNDSNFICNNYPINTTYFEDSQLDNSQRYKNQNMVFYDSSLIQNQKYPMNLASNVCSQNYSIDNKLNYTFGQGGDFIYENKISDNKLKLETIMSIKDKKTRMEQLKLNKQWIAEEKNLLNSEKKESKRVMDLLKMNNEASPRRGRKPKKLKSSDERGSSIDYLLSDVSSFNQLPPIDVNNLNDNTNDHLSEKASNSSLSNDLEEFARRNHFNSNSFNKKKSIKK